MSSQISKFQIIYVVTANSYMANS